MKKFFLAVMALFMSFTANAFEFDGIDLNGSVADITKQVSRQDKHYSAPLSDAPSDNSMRMLSDTEVPPL